MFSQVIKLIVLSSEDEKVYALSYWTTARSSK